jgi:hypothetical protein
MRLLDPPSLDTGIYNDCLAILTRHPKTIEDTFMPDGLPVLRFAPAIKIIGRTIGKIFYRLYTVFKVTSIRVVTPGISLSPSSTPSSFRLASKFNSMRAEARRGSELGTKSV